MLDLGCNIGLTIADYEEMWPAARILGVEVDAGNAAVALSNCRSPILCAAVAGRSGPRRYGGSAEYAFALDSDGDREGRAVTLDRLAVWMGGTVDFVKMDVEGAEWEILVSGGWESAVESLLVELHPQTDGSVAAASRLLEGRGYRTVRHRPHPAAVWATRRDA